MGLRPLPDLPALTGTGRFDPAFAQTNLEVAAALVRFIICTSATRLFYLSLFSIAFGTLARIYFFNRAGDYVARVGVIQVNFVASKYDYAKKVGRALVGKHPLHRCCTIRVDVVDHREVSGYRLPA
jgi:hypothetical protein